MAHAEKCPVCNGTGKITVSNYYCDCSLTVPEPQTTTVICHGCGGSGWVTVQDDCPCKPYKPYEPFEPYKPEGPWDNIYKYEGPSPKIIYWLY